MFQPKSFEVEVNASPDFLPSLQIVFQILVAYLPVSLVVPCVNAIQVASSAATSQLLGESRPSMQTAVGCLFVTFGVFIMMSVE